MINYEELGLSKKDKQTLKSIYKSKGIITDLVDDDSFVYLIDNNLIQYDIRNGVYYAVVTPNYERYLNSKRNRFIERKIPIVLSIIAIVISIVALIVSVLNAW